MLKKENTAEITFRNATDVDVDLVFSWSNESLVRLQSFKTEPIIYENHVKWFTTKVCSEDDLFLIALINETPAGFIRFEQIQTKTVISILVDSNFRGKGYSHSILKGAVENYFQNFRSPIFAFIKKTNIPSIKAFERAGFSFLKELDVHGYPSFVYTIKAKAES